MSSDNRGGEGRVIYGIHAVKAALAAGSVHGGELMLGDVGGNPRLAEIERLAEERGLPIRKVTRRDLDRLHGGARHQGVVLMVETAVPVAGVSLEDILASCGEHTLLLVLDGVEDPHNLGACLRTADAAGVQAVIVPRDRAAGMTATVRKVASGAAETVPLVQVTNLARALRQLQDAGVWVIGTDADADLSLYDADLTGPLALALGAEGRGLRRLTREHCDRLISIPMSGAVESLNVSVAAGVCLFEARRQRRPSS